FKDEGKTGDAKGLEGTGLSILVVDDYGDAAQMLSRLLSLDGHRVEIAHDGPAAIAAAKRAVPDVVLLDIGLPGMDGYEVAQKLREIEGFDRVLVIALTGYGKQADREESASFDHYLLKPVDPARIRQLILDWRSREGR
ncbi:MAG: response regulator, partial [Candidatus Eisenbacteria bacterium]|nr:response regulator [Candidatus Eisenbacteria bacterium]